MAVASDADQTTLDCLEQRVKLELMRGSCSTLDALQRSVLSLRFDDLKIFRSYVGSSTEEGGGRGLFASRKIAAGELVTCFPGDWVLDEDPVDGGFSVTFGQHIPDIRRDLQHATSSDARDYELLLSLDGGVARVIGDPLAVDDAAYLGHLANDCAMLLEPEGIFEYALSASQRANTNHVSVLESHIAVVASREIEQDEELFVSYGPGYWLTRNGFTAKVGEAQTALGLEMRKGGHVAKVILHELKKRGDEQHFPPWILDCYETRG